MDKRDRPTCANAAHVGAWICGLGGIGLGWVQATWYVFHPDKPAPDKD